jgi:hypothetical protein
VRREADLKFSDDDLCAAHAAGIITAAQCDALLGFLAPRSAIRDAHRAADEGRGKFDVVHLLWYGGALTVMSAMGLFSTVAFAQMGGVALTATAVVYAVLFLGAGHYLWRVSKLETPGGLLIAVAVSMAPLAVFGVEDALGWWSKFGKPGTPHDFYVWIKGSWIFMEIAALAAAALALRFYRFPFIVLIAGIALWFMSMDLVPWLTGTPAYDFEVSRKVSVWFGLAMLAAAVAVNLRQRSGDFAFWLYLFGMITFWGGITASSNGTAFDKALYWAMNVSLLMLSTVIGRRVFAVFGTIGVAIYLGDLAGKVFKDSLMFPFALSAIGVGIIAFGLYYHRRQAAVQAWMDAQLPPALKRLRPV